MGLFAPCRPPPLAVWSAVPTSTPPRVPLLEEDSGTISHLTFNGTALKDTKGHAWAQAGTVPQNAASASVAPYRPSGGPTSDANYYSLAPNATWIAAGATAIARLWAVGALLNTGKVLMAGGVSSDYFKTCDLYDPATNTVAATGQMAAKRAYSAGVLLSTGKVLVAGGYNGSSLSSCELYDPIAGTWSNTGSMSTQRDVFTLTALSNGNVLAAGGSASAVCEIYDVAAGTWSNTGSLVTARSYHCANLLPNGKVLVVGGVNGTALSSCELYDPGTGTWAATGSLSVIRVEHTTNLLSTGKVLVVGGWDNISTYYSSCELYNPATGLWGATGAMSVARSVHTTSILSNGNVLVIGGYGGTRPVICQIYDVTGGTWSDTGSTAVSHSNHAEAVLPNGSVFIASGYTGAGNTTACELYDPQGLNFAGDWSATVIMDASSDLAGNPNLGSSYSSSKGWFVQGGGSPTAFTFYEGTGQTGIAANGCVSGVNILSFGRSGGNIYCKLNGGTTKTGTSTQGSSSVSWKLGKANFGGRSWAANIYEAHFTTTPFNETAIQNIHTRFFDLVHPSPWVGLPRPTIDVIPRANGDMICTGGVMATKAGTPTTGTSPFGVNGGSGNAPSEVLNGSTDYYTLGLNGNQSGNFSIASLFNQTTLGSTWLFGKDEATTTRQWHLRGTSGNMKFSVYKDAATSSDIQPSALIANQPQALVAAYQYVGDGTSHLRLAMSGVSASEITNSVGPPMAAAAINLEVGASNGGYLWNGRVDRNSIWSGTAFTNAQLARATAAVWTPECSRPAGSALTVTRASVANKIPDATIGTMYSYPANQLSIGTDGADIYGAIKNWCLQSQTIVSGTALTSPWYEWHDAGADAGSFVADAAAAPDGTLTADQVNFGQATNNQADSICQTVTTTAAVWTFSVWMRTVSGTGTVLMVFGPASGGSWPGDFTVTTCNLTTTWTRFTAVHTCSAADQQCNIQNRGVGGTSPATPVYIWGAQVEASPFASPYVATTTLAVTQPATACSMNNPFYGKNPSNWAVGIRATLSDWSVPDGNLHWLYNTGAGANTHNLLVLNSHILFTVYDNDNNYVQITSTGTYSGSGEHSVVGMNSNGTLSIFVDGLPIACNAPTGVGTGLVSVQPATVYLGITSGGSQPLNGSIKKIVCGESANQVIGELNRP